MTDKFIKDGGPKSIYSSLSKLLRGDAVLRGLIGYTRENMNIRRSFQPTGQWDKIVIYYFQPEFLITDSNPNVRQIPLIVAMYSRDNELVLFDIAERLKQLIDTQSNTQSGLSVDGKVHVYTSFYESEVVSLAYDDQLKAHWKSLRFLLTIRT